MINPQDFGSKRAAFHASALKAYQPERFCQYSMARADFPKNFSPASPDREGPLVLRPVEASGKQQLQK
jgi:hypothetical protein